MSLKTNGQIEAAACEVLIRFHHDTMGRGPRSVKATLRTNVLFVHLEDVLTTAEKTVVSAGSGDPARSIELIREMRNHLVQQARGELLATLSRTIGTRAVGMMHDIDPTTASEVLVFHLADQPYTSRRRA